MAIKLQTHIPVEVEVGAPEKLKLGVKRLTFQELVELRSKYRATLQAKEDESDAQWLLLLAESFQRYVRIDSEVVVELADGEERLRKGEGEQLLQWFGGDSSVIMTIFLSILAQNSLDAQKKMNSPRRSALSPSSGEQERAQAGQKLETTAGSAGNGDSAGNEDATPEASPPSGSTEGAEAKEGTTQSPSTNVPSVH